MKILIVDDEPHVIRAIRQLVPWEELGIQQVLEAGSGRAALELLEKEAPELMITDVVMPDLTGLELMQILRQSHPETKVIVMSGYSDFEYVRATLVSGGVDYLLKPLDPGQLVRTVRRAAQEWEKEEEARLAKRRDKRTLRLISGLAAESLLERMLFQSGAALSYEEQTRLAPELRDAAHCTVCLLDTAYVYSGAALQDSAALALREQAFRRVLAQRRCGYLLHPPAVPTQRVIFLYRDFEQALGALETALVEGNQGADFHMHFGVSERQAFPAQFQKAYRQAAEAFYSASAAHVPRPLLVWREGLESGAAPEDAQREQAMLSAVLSGDAADARRAAREWLHAIALEGRSLQYTAAALERYRELEQGWITQLSRRYSGFSARPAPLPGWAELSQGGLLSLPRVAEALGARMEALHARLHLAGAGDGDARIRQVAHYLEENYEKPFSQEECAARFFMSRDYMCRRFTKELGVSMVSYLNGVRIRQAKLLMADPNATLRDIAHRVGFEDEKYFARQFKRIEGVSPGEYRARLAK